MYRFLKIARAFLVGSSYVLISFSTYSWISELRFKDSELLPILISSTVNMLCFILYKMISLSPQKTAANSPNALFRLLPSMGFYANFIFIGLCVIVIVGFGIIP